MLAATSDSMIWVGAGELAHDPEERQRQANLIMDQSCRDIDHRDIEQQQDFAEPKLWEQSSSSDAMPRKRGGIFPMPSC